MIKFIYILLVLSFISGSFAQTKGESDKKWEKKGKGYRYLRDSKYKGPKDWYGSSPSSMKNVETNESSGGAGSSSGISTDRIDESRNRKGGENGGDIPKDPKTQQAEPIELPEVDPPDVDPPDLPDVDPPTLSENFWRILMILLIAALVIFLIYMFVKNRKPGDKKVVTEVADFEWNPEVISKSELELRLEEALARNDYRECVRIYFTFILKELIRKNWIHWKKEKTNHDYLLEMNSKPNAFLFREAVRIYDLVWYGEYEIDESAFRQLQPTLNKYYKILQEEK